MFNTLRRFSKLLTAVALSLSLCSLWIWQNLAHATAKTANAAPAAESLTAPLPAPLPAQSGGFLAPQRSSVLVKLQEETRKVDLSAIAQRWLDPSPDTTPAQLSARASSGADFFQPGSARDTHLTHDKVLWLRFELQDLDRRSHWFLELGSALTDDVQLHWRDPQGQWQVQKAGDAIARARWPVQSRLPTFVLPNMDGQSVEYFLRIVHQRAPVSVQLTVWRDTALMAAQQSQMLLLGVFFGLMLLVLLVSMVMATLMRDRAFVAYSGYLITVGGFMFTNMGLSAQYLWPHSPLLADRMVFVLASLTAATGPWLVRIILKPVVRLRILDSMIALMVGLMLLIALIEAFSPTVFSYVILNYATMLTLVLIYGLVAAAWQRGDTATRWVAIGFVPVVLGALPLLMRNMGLIANSNLTQYSMLVGSALEMPILLYALLSRSSKRRDSIMRATGLPTQDALTRLPNLRQLLSQLHGAISRASRYRHHYGLMLVELSNEAWFAKEHGREMADRALILLAARLQQLAREIDTVSRIDQTHFALLSEGPCSPRMMAQLATRIAASGLKPNEVLPIGAVLKLKITCALMPHAQAQEMGDDGHAQLGWLIAQADAIPADSRKTVHTLGF